MECEFRFCLPERTMEDVRLMKVLGSRHLDLRGNLIKAMMVMNWLNMLEVEKF